MSISLLNFRKGVGMAGNIRTMLFVCVFVIFWGFSCHAQEDIPGRTDKWVNDFAGIIDIQTRDYLETRLSSIKQQTPDPIEVIVATFNTTGGYDVEYFTREYGEKWRDIRKDQRDNGVVIVVILDGSHIRLGIGRNIENIITPDVARRIITDDMTPFFENGNYSQGVKAAVDTVIDILENANIPSDVPFVRTMALILFAIGIITFFVVKKRKKVVNESK